jgi:hypothetical protein
MARPKKSERVYYLYGIVGSDREVGEGMTGINDAPVELIPHKNVAALASTVDPNKPLGMPEDLVAHKELLDATAADVPVLPFRFGAVLASRDAVVQELLEPHERQLTTALREIDGKAQYVVRARYVEDAVLREILAENPKAEQLRERIGPNPDESEQRLRIQLGEMINSAVEAKRNADTNALIEALEPVTVATAIRQPTHEMDAAHVALLEDVDQHVDVEDALTEMADKWAGRADVRLLGPMAPYDFVVTTQ